MCALRSGMYSCYTKKEIQAVLYIAYTSFMAAKIEAIEYMEGKMSELIIHTGNWGTGAFGNNFQLMALC